MVSPALTIRFFSYYVLTMGILLLVFPSFVLGLLRVDVVDNDWIRVLGLAVIVAGVYYFISAQNEATWFFRASIAVRIGNAVLLAVLAVSSGPLQLLVLALLELAGSLWTRRALHKTERWA